MLKKIGSGIFLSILLSFSSLSSAVSCKDFKGAFKGSLGSEALTPFTLQVNPDGVPGYIWFSFNDQSSGIIGCPSKFISCTEVGVDQVNIELGVDYYAGFYSRVQASMTDNDHLNVSLFQCIHNGIPYANLVGKGILTRYR